LAKIYTDILLDFTADMVLRGQGADPVVVRKRRPVLVDLSQKAIDVGAGLISPAVIHDTFTVSRDKQKGIFLNGKYVLAGELISEQLSGADKIALAVVTIGSALEEKIHQTGLDGDMALSLALDGLANAAVDMLSFWYCRQIEQQAEDAGQASTIAFSPGMLGWSVEQGQPQVFDALKPDPQMVKLLPSGMMLPRKSASMAIGLGGQIQGGGKPCKFCSMNSMCSYHQAMETV
jgi:hypothetical protein